MELLSKISPKLKAVIFIVIFGLLFIFGAVGFLLLSSEYQKTEQLQQNIKTISAEKTKIENKLQDSKAELAEANKLLSDSKSKVQILTSQLDSEKKSKETIEGQINNVNSKLKRETEMKDKLEEKVSLLEGDLENFLTRFKELEQEKNNLAQQLSEYEAKVELATITLDAENETQVKQKTIVTQLSGSIIRVNKNYDFLVIDIGENQGVKKGDIFSVYHAGAYIGDVEIEKVHSTMSAANFLPNLKVDLVRDSDTAVKKD